MSERFTSCILGHHLDRFTLAALQECEIAVVRALAVTTEQRSPALPDVPAIAEFVPGYSVSGWNGMWAPAGTPREIVSRLNQALARMLQQPDIQERLRASGREPAHSTPEEFARVIARDIAMWSKVVKSGNIRID